MLGKWYLQESFSKREKLARSAITFRYSIYALGFLTAFIAMVVFVNLVGPRLHSLDSISVFLKKQQEEEEEEARKQRLVSSSRASNGVTDSASSTGISANSSDDRSKDQSLAHQEEHISAGFSQKNSSAVPAVTYDSGNKSRIPERSDFNTSLQQPIGHELSASSLDFKTVNTTENTSLLETQSKRADTYNGGRAHQYDTNNTKYPAGSASIRPKSHHVQHSSFTLFPPWISKYIFVYTRLLPSNAIKLPLYYIVWVWAVVFVFLIFSETQYEFTYLAKRLGSIPLALLPPVYFLTLRPSPLPQTVYLQLIPFHKWLSRLVFLMLVAHALTYFYIYVVLGKTQKLLGQIGLCGAAALLCFVAIVLTSLKPFRRRFYNKVFYPTHYVLSWAILPLIYFHYPKRTYAYVYGCLAIVVFQLCYRLYLSRTEIRLPVQYVSSSLLFIAIPREKLPESFQHYFSPGSHLGISSSPMPIARLMASVPIPQFLRQRLNQNRPPRPNGSFVSSLIQSTHPYTIASLPQDPFLMLCIRKTRYPIKLNKAYTIAGPYASVPPPFFDDISRGHVKRALFVAGGTGIAFCAPLMRHLRNMNVPVKLLWAIRDMNDAKALAHLGLVKAALEDKQIEIYVTRGGRLLEPKDRATKFFENIRSVTKKASGHFSVAKNEMSNIDDDSSDEDNDERETSAASDAFQGMFTPQTVDERLFVTIDNTLCDGGENRAIGGPQAKSVPSYVDDNGRIVEIDTSDSNSTALDSGNSTYDEESALQSTITNDSYGSVNQTVQPYEPSATTPNPTFWSTKLLSSNKRSNQTNKNGPVYTNFPSVSAPDLDFTSVMINSRPVLNLRLKSWLYGVAVDGNSCCCVDQLLKTDMNTDQPGRWILASGGETLVGETERWAKENGFSFFKDEFSL